MKRCPNCGNTVHAKKLKCPCGYVFRSMSNCIAMQFLLVQDRVLMKNINVDCVDYNQKEVYYQARNHCHDGDYCPYHCWDGPFILSGWKPLSGWR